VNSLLNQADIDNIAANLDLRYKVIDNLAYNGAKYKAQIKLTNKGQTSIEKGDWTVFFCSIRLVLPQTGSQPVKFEHINGCLHKFQPTVDFADLSPGTSLDIGVTAQWWVVARTDIMPNWYVSAPGLKAKIIASTVGESLSFVDPFTTKEQWKRFPGDTYDPYSAKKRYDEVEIDVISSQYLPVIIPQPMYLTGLDRGKRIDINKEWKIFVDDGLEKETKLLTGENLV
jgi:hexosaminidase